MTIIMFLLVVAIAGVYLYHRHTVEVQYKKLEKMANDNQKAGLYDEYYGYGSDERYVKRVDKAIEDMLDTHRDAMRALKDK